MKFARTLFAASIGVALAAACGGSSTGPSGGAGGAGSPSSGAGSGSSSSSSSSSSSGSGGAGTGSGSGAGTSSGVIVTDSGAIAPTGVPCGNTENNLQIYCVGSQVCCTTIVPPEAGRGPALAEQNCVADQSACPTGGIVMACMGSINCPGKMCCLEPGDGGAMGGGGFASSFCESACSATGVQICPDGYGLPHRTNLYREPRRLHDVCGSSVHRTSELRRGTSMLHRRGRRRSRQQLPGDLPHGLDASLRCQRRLPGRSDVQHGRRRRFRRNGRRKQDLRSAAVHGGKLRRGHGLLRGSGRRACRLRGYWRDGVQRPLRHGCRLRCRPNLHGGSRGGRGDDVCDASLYASELRGGRSLLHRRRRCGMRGDGRRHVPDGPSRLCHRRRLPGGRRLHGGRRRRDSQLSSADDDAAGDGRRSQDDADGRKWRRLIRYSGRGRYVHVHDECIQRSQRTARAATSSPMASEAVAAGEGALMTCTMRSPSANAKSSSSEPSRATAWARTPAPPGAKSSACTSGTSVAHARANALRLSDRTCSRSPFRQCIRAIRQKPGQLAMSHASRASKLDREYPSRFRASTALGPASIPPAIRLVKCTPRNGNAGSGTG